MFFSNSLKQTIMKSQITENIKTDQCMKKGLHLVLSLKNSNTLKNVNIPVIPNHHMWAGQ